MAQPFVLMSELERIFKLLLPQLLKLKIMFLGWEFVQIITYILTTMFSFSCPL